MASKSDFSADEWSKVVEGPLFAGVRVIAAGRGGTIRESLAIGRAYAEARRAHGTSQLLDDLVAAPPSFDPRTAGQGGDLQSTARERLDEAVAILREKATPEDLDVYRRFVLDVAQSAAEAHREGGFMGVGGKPVSEEEQAALDDVAAAFGEAAS